MTYYQYPDTHWIRIRTNNPLERTRKGICRRIRVGGAFPDGHSALILAAARLRHIAGAKWGSKRYLSMEPLEEMKLENQLTALDRCQKVRKILYDTGSPVMAFRLAQNGTVNVAGDFDDGAL